MLFYLEHRGRSLSREYASNRDEIEQKLAFLEASGISASSHVVAYVS